MKPSFDPILRRAPRRPTWLGAPLTVLLAALGLSVSASALACATCGCALSSDAAMGYGAPQGWQVSLQFDYINQNQLRHGTDSISVAGVAAINDAGGTQEVEQQTVNRYFTLGLGYTLDRDWSVRVLVPFIDRSHSTYGQVGNPVSSADISGADVNSLGDARFVVSWQGLLPTHNLGFQVGLKLPTGNYGGANSDATGVVGRNPVAFNSGPNSQTAAPGNLLDTSLQAGSGSTDLILGAFYYQPVSQNFDAFLNGQIQTAVAHRLDQPGMDYRPGNQQAVSLGLRYEEHPELVPQLQVNLTHRTADQGFLADTRGTAGTVLYLSPGVGASLFQRIQAYAFIQLPIYSNLSGYQLFPHWTATVGATYSF